MCAELVAPLNQRDTKEKGFVKQRQFLLASPPVVKPLCLAKEVIATKAPTHLR
jgi:hypothetical protein